MSSDATATDPDRSTPTTLPILRALRRHLADGLRAVCTAAPFRTLNVPQRAVLTEILCAWVRGEDFNQAALASLCGYRVRRVRTLVRQLEHLGGLAATRQEGRIVYVAGARLHDVLDDFAWGRNLHMWPPGSWLRDFPRPATIDTSAGTEPATIDRGAPARADVDAARPATIDHHERPHAVETGPDRQRPARIDRVGEGGPARIDPSNCAAPTPFGDVVARNLQRLQLIDPESFAPDGSRSSRVLEIAAPPDSSLIKKKILTNSSPSETGPTRPGSLAPLDRTTLRAAAHRALTARHRLAYPDHAPPATFAAADIDVLVAVTEQDSATVAELDQMHLDAIAGASLKSKNKPPTVAFIWGKRDYFLQNVRDGRERRGAAVVRTAPKRRPEREGPPATSAEVAAIARRAIEQFDRIPHPPSRRRTGAGDPDS